MKRLWWIFLVLMMILSVNVQPVSAASYAIAQGDVLSIDVFGLEEMQFKEIIVRPDGKIDFPLIGEIQAAGSTPSELALTMQEKLAPFVKAPKVSVNIARFHTIKVYVLGEVNRPGIIELQYSHTVIDAIAGAGSWTKDAAKKKIHLIRYGQKSDPIVVNLLHMLKKGDTTQNYELGNGDILFLDGNGRLDWARDIAPIISSSYYISRLDD
ncbi:MAG: polysaccharide export protein [Firmicutes bacterium]|nr:polysaccharide export protein [Bacillota bacterium]